MTDNGFLYDLNIKYSFFCRQLNCTLSYLVFLEISIILTWFFVTQLGFATINIDDARATLSSLIQIQATILSISIAIIMVLFQLESSSYSLKSVNNFFRTLNIWIFLGAYVSMLSSEFFILKSMSVYLAKNNDFFLNLSVTFGLFSLFSLVLFFIFMIDSLKVEKIIEKYLIKVNSENIIENKGEILQPIFEIINHSLSRYDLATARFGLYNVVDKSFLISDKFNDEKMKEIFEIILNYLRQSYKIAENLNDEQTGFVVIDSIKRFAKGTIDLAYYSRNIDLMYEIMTESIIKDTIDPIIDQNCPLKNNTYFYAIELLYSIGEEASKKKHVSQPFYPLVTYFTVNRFSDILSKSIEENSYQIFRYIPKYIGNIFKNISCGKGNLNNCLLMNLYFIVHDAIYYTIFTVQLDSVNDSKIGSLINAFDPIDREIINEDYESIKPEFDKILQRYDDLAQLLFEKGKINSMNKIFFYLYRLGEYLYNIEELEQVNKILDFTFNADLKYNKSSYATSKFLQFMELDSLHNFNFNHEYHDYFKEYFKDESLKSSLF